ncbi:sex peptide receptor-like [Mizuhopecten yessoensis]|uniref:FMRFamide receptor n=1 Tax=Mizuhopecten yessoensis TaxID=6573 RepID=A0A210Q5R7_MIZYE|nr:sex peptide receptor-like [Mizuhopecten yessoensis]XP_021366573.1 sex peptide receptor-like [Mizuhopecten yessoensis]XP_021366574.1 sex peptide receptor-like [Mizuhopecten yessoensis]XP_021366575.1 sex peptide receptor-like [Mizuhopecten yessoensis]OWF44055.1 FMRFamide receptor [Mizuhopecten yessoensis]
MNDDFSGYHIPNVTGNNSAVLDVFDTSTMGNYVSTVEEISGLRKFEEWYKPIHGYLAAIVCVFGVIANILNIVVLTRKNMQTSTNVILTGLAISDGVTMAAYFPWALWMYIIYGTDVSPKRDTLECARFQMWYAIFSVIVHSISIWLTVTLAVFRFIFIRFPRRGTRYCNIQRAKLAVVIVVIVVTIVCIPNSVNYEIYDGFAGEIIGPQWGNASVYWVNQKKNTDFQEFINKFNFWIQALLVKLLPCVMLTVFSFLLVKTMRDAEKRRKKLLSKTPVSDGESGATSSGGGNHKKNKKGNRSNRTTTMLLLVVLLFLLTETPQGVLSVLSGLIKGFFRNVYTPLGDLIDIVALINNGINFVLYCTMSKQFRDTFFNIFLRNSPGDRRKTTTTYITTQQTHATKDSDV